MKLLFIIRYVKSNIVSTPSHIFVMVICLGYLPQLFAVGICRSYLPWLFAVRICRDYLPWVCFVYVSKPFFCVSKCFFFLSKSFLIESKRFFYVRISLLTVFLFAIAVVVIGHRRNNFLNDIYLFIDIVLSRYSEK